jgi:signal transduction histidine kinase
MSTRTAARAAWTAAGLAAALGISGLVANQVAGLELVGWRSIFLVAWVLTFALLGALIVSKQPSNVFGWIFTLAALLVTFNLAGAAYANFAVIKERGAWPAGEAIAFLAGGWNWIPITAILLIFIPLLFPSGRLLSPRWRWVVWCAAAFVVLAAIPNALWPGPLFDTPRIRNPIGLEGSADFLDRIRTVSLIPAVAGVAGALASLALRFRRTTGQERQQLKWFLYGCVLFMIPLLVKGPVPVTIQDVLTVVLWPALPISLGIAMLKYRLYDIDPVLNKSVVFGALAVFITAVYVGVVVGIGSLIGSAGRPNLALSIVATAIVAIAFQPVRGRVQRIANRLVYGKRATPYEVMADFSERMAGVLSVDDVLPRMAEAAARGVGGQAARIRLFLPDGSERTVSWPAGGAAGHVDRVLPVSYRGGPIGEIAVAKAVGEPVTPAEGKLLTDLATQAGLVMHNVRLTVELQARLAEISSQAAELRVSRQRIVAAQDEERRRLEETIRLGCERQLSPIKDELKSAETRLTNDPRAAVATLERLMGQATAVLEELRELARGIYPPVLQDEGLVAALRIHLRKINPSITLQSDGIGRYPSEIEAAIYFCCVEALRGAVGPAAVRLGGDAGGVDFWISGCGPLDGRLERMEDRVEALGGSLEFDGSTLGGSIPLGVHPPPLAEGRVGAQFSR